MLVAMLYHYNIYGVDQLCISISVTITSAIAIERFTAVFFPFKVSRIFTSFRAKLLVLCIVVYICSIGSPVFHHYKAVKLFNNNTRTFYYRVYNTEWWILNGIDYYVTFIANNLIGSTNMIVVLICSSAIALKLTYLTYTRQRLTSKSAAINMKAHKMILIVCVVCFVVFAPTSVLEFVRYLRLGSTIIPYDFISYFLYGVHASVNSLIYVATSNKFYKTYKIIFCRR
jgi:hypothetical protein